MKKQFIFRAIAAIVVMLTVSINVQAKSGEMSNAAAQTGKYNLVSMESSDGTDFMAFFKTMGFDPQEFYIELKDNGKCVLFVALDGDEEVKEVTYKVDGKSIVIHVDDDEMKGTIEDNKITIEIGDESETANGVVSMSLIMVFQKK